MQHKLKRQQVKDWLESPVSIALLKLIDEHLEAHKDGLRDRLLYTSSFDLIKEELLQVKGQIFTLELIRDVENFLDEEIEDEKVQTDQTVYNGEDQ